MYHAQIVQEHEGRMQMQQNVNGDLWDSLIIALFL